MLMSPVWVNMYKLDEMIRTIVAVIFCAVVALVCACTNIFTTFSNTESDESLLVAAKQYINAQDYNDAIAQFPPMSTAYQTRHDVIALRASAYAGRAGLNFLTLVNNLQNIGATNLMLFIMQNFESGSAGKMSDMLTAQNYMISIFNIPGGPDNDELVELMVIAMGNIGVMLSKFADTNNDGVVDAGFNPCVAASLPGIVGDVSPNDVTQQIGVSLNWIATAAAQLTANGVNFGPAGLSGATAACTALTGGGFGAYAFCGVTNGGAFTANQLLGIRSLINEKSAGIGLATCNGTIIACHC